MKIPALFLFSWAIANKLAHSAPTKEEKRASLGSDDHQSSSNKRPRVVLGSALIHPNNNTNAADDASLEVAQRLVDVTDDELDIGSILLSLRNKDVNIHKDKEQYSNSGQGGSFPDTDVANYTVDENVESQDQNDTDFSIETYNSEPSVSYQYDEFFGDMKKPKTNTKDCHIFSEHPNAYAYIKFIHVSREVYDHCKFNPEKLANLKSLNVIESNIASKPDKSSYFDNSEENKLIKSWNKFKSEYPKLEKLEVYDSKGAGVLHHTLTNFKTNDKIKALKEILETDLVSVNSKDHRGNTPLHLCMASDLFRLEKNKNIDTTICLKILLAKGANPIAFSKSKWTPIHFAACLSYEEPIKTLLDNGGNINIGLPQGKKEMDNKEKFSPIHASLLSLKYITSHRHILGYYSILVFGRNIYAISAAGNNFWSDFDAKQIKEKKTAFHYLLKGRADLSLKFTSKNVLLLAISKKNKDATLDILETELSAEVIDGAFDVDGTSALMAAQFMNWDNVYKKLVVLYDRYKVSKERRVIAVAPSATQAAVSIITSVACTKKDSKRIQPTNSVVAPVEQLPPYNYIGINSRRPFIVSEHLSNITLSSVSARQITTSSSTFSPRFFNMKMNQLTPQAAASTDPRAPVQPSSQSVLPQQTKLQNQQQPQRKIPIVSKSDFVSAESDNGPTSKGPERLIVRQPKQETNTESGQPQFSVNELQTPAINPDVLDKNSFSFESAYKIILADPAKYITRRRVDPDGRIKESYLYGVLIITFNKWRLQPSEALIKSTMDIFHYLPNAHFPPTILASTETNELKTIDYHFLMFITFRMQNPELINMVRDRVPSNIYRQVERYDPQQGLIVNDFYRSEFLKTYQYIDESDPSFLVYKKMLTESPWIRDGIREIRMTLTSVLSYFNGIYPSIQKAKIEHIKPQRNSDIPYIYRELKNKYFPNASIELGIELN